MLTESFFVRRLKKSIDPETGAVTGVERDEQGEVGVVRSLAINLVPDQASKTGFTLSTILGVCWEKTNYPAISFEDPTELEHLDDTLSLVLDRMSDDYGEDFFFETLSKFHERYGREAIEKTLDAIEAPDEGEEGEEEEEDDGDSAGTQPAQQ